MKWQDIFASFAIKNNDRCEWSIQQSGRMHLFLEKDQKLPVEFVEQPIPAGMNEESTYLKKYSPFPLFADESITHSADFGILKTQFDGVNVKLMKAGSYMNGIRLLTEARKRGMKTMIGCMVETTLGIRSGMNLCIDWLCWPRQFSFSQRRTFSVDFRIGWRIAFQYERTVMCMSVFLPLSSLQEILTTRDREKKRFFSFAAALWKPVVEIPIDNWNIIRNRSTQLQLPFTSFFPPGILYHQQVKWSKGLYRKICGCNPGCDPEFFWKRYSDV